MDLQASRPFKALTSSHSKGNLNSLAALVFLVLVPIGVGLIIAHVVVSQLGLLDFLMVGFVADLYQTIMGVFATLDKIVLFLFASFTSLIFLRAYKINMPVIFGIVGLFGLSGLVIVSGAASGMFSMFTNQSIVASSANSFPLTATLFQNLELTVAAIGGLLLVVMVGVRNR